MSDAEDPGFRAALEKGIALFNEERFFEAYEVWSERWSEEGGDGSDLLQGLVQIAVGFAKLTGGEAKGTVKLLDSAALKIGAYAPRAYDLDIDALLGLIHAWRDVAADMVANGPRAAASLPRASLSKKS